MRPSNKRSRSKQNRPRTLGNVVNRVFDSSGPEGKVRGTPQQIIEKYLVLARDAQLSGDRVAAENFQQHAEHYTRMLNEAQAEQTREAEQRREQQQQQSNQSRRGDQRDDTDAESGETGEQKSSGEPHPEPRQERPEWKERRNTRRNNRRDADPRDSDPRDADRRDEPRASDDSDSKGGDSGDSGHSMLVETPEARSERRAPRAKPTPPPSDDGQPAARPDATDTPMAEDKPKRVRKPRIKAEPVGEASTAPQPDNGETTPVSD
ncbi:MAG: DUF4167 domain-containing protein [Pararhodobacter sp.]|nr:DUF4167 domain-containing protein [Pararhodobacter sp.]